MLGALSVFGQKAPKFVDDAVRRVVKDLGPGYHLGGIPFAYEQDTAHLVRVAKRMDPATKMWDYAYVLVLGHKREFLLKDDKLWMYRNHVADYIEAQTGLRFTPAAILKLPARYEGDKDPKLVITPGKWVDGEVAVNLAGEPSGKLSSKAGANLESIKTHACRELPELKSLDWSKSTGVSTPVPGWEIGDKKLFVRCFIDGSVMVFKEKKPYKYMIAGDNPAFMTEMLQEIGSFVFKMEGLNGKSKSMGLATLGAKPDYQSISIRLHQRAEPAEWLGVATTDGKVEVFNNDQPYYNFTIEDIKGKDFKEIEKIIRESVANKTKLEGKLSSRKEQSLNKQVVISVFRTPPPSSYTARFYPNGKISFFQGEKEVLNRKIW